MPRRGKLSIPLRKSTSRPDGSNVFFRRRDRMGATFFPSAEPNLFELCRDVANVSKKRCGSRRRDRMGATFFPSAEPNLFELCRDVANVSKKRCGSRRRDRMGATFFFDVATEWEQRFFSTSRPDGSNVFFDVATEWEQPLFMWCISSRYSSACRSEESPVDFR